MVRKVKSEAVPVAVPQSRDEAALYVKAIGDAQRERERLETAMNQEIADLKAQYEAAGKPHTETIARLKQGVQIWCEANRAALTDNGKTKTAQLATGEVRWRTTPPAVSLKSLKSIIAFIKDRRSFALFLRTKEEVDKEALLKHPEKARLIPGVTIGQREEFVIVPFETKLEEIA
jgi:phage host-nuclease inhibitor protein Gam